MAFVSNVLRTLVLAAFAASLAVDDVRAASAGTCTISAITASYGAVDILAGASVDTTGSFSVTCSGGTASTAVRFCLEMGAGATAAGPSGERVLRSSSDYIDHELYFDSGRTQIWGSSGAVVTAYPSGSPADIQQDVTLDGSGGGTFNYTVYGRIFGGQQTKTPGSYSWTGVSPALTYRLTSGATSCPTSGGASANSSGSNFSATVNANCNISTTALNFGSTPSTIASDIDAAATITADCTNTTPYAIGLDNGANVSGSQRRMRLGATSNYLNYGLYTDTARSNAWASAASTTTCVNGANTCALGTGAGSNQSVTVYGRVPAQTAPSAGTFTDTVIVTVTF